jgi:beta-1,4-N-acetylglucosaminyltransferase
MLMAIYIHASQLVNLHSPQTVYIESLARVRRLSLSGRILRLFADRFFVQWEALADSTRAPPSTWLARKEYRGVLV